MTAQTMNHQTSSSENATYAELDFTNDVRAQLTVGGGAVLVGFFTMACPLMTQTLFSQLLSAAFTGFATVLVVMLCLSGNSVSQIAGAVGFKRHATLISSLFLASFSLTLYPEIALFLAAATVIVYFLLDEVTALLLAFRSGNLKAMALPGADLLVTLICVAMLVSGLSIHGVFVVSAVLGLKVVLLGSSMVLALSEPKSKAHY
ncbi:hypothetical protein [Vibrio comitans]